MFQVKTMSQLLGVDRSFLHYYDQIGIIVPDKNEKKYRFYRENDLIALASSKYYRAMEMPLKELSQMILESGLEEKRHLMEAQREYLLRKSALYTDMATVADYALAMYQTAYRDGIHGTGPMGAYEFICTVRNGHFDREFLSSQPVRDLLNFFPFVSYTCYFPPRAVLDESAFRFEIGLSVIPAFRKKYGLALPANAVTRPDQQAVIFTLSKDMDSETFTFQDFEPLREYARQEGISLSGEGIAYCVFSNYEREHGVIKYVIYFSQTT